MAPHKLNNRYPESIATTDETNKFWTCSVLERGPWLKQLPHTLAADDANFRTLWEECFITDKNIAYTQSPQHSYHLSISNIKKHDLTDPCPLLSFEKLDASIPDAEVPDALARGFREAPTALKSYNRLLHDRILFYISNIKGKEDYERQANGNFITLIRLIVAEDNDADAEIATWANTEKNKLVKAGLSTNTIVAFDYFRLQFENYNDMCKQGAGGRRDDDSVIATIYTNVVRDLGDLIETRLEMKLDAVGAAGDLTKTVKVIRKLLGRMEGKATSTGAAHAAAGRRDDEAFNAAAIAAARAAAGRDPIIGGPGGGGAREDRPPPVWTRGTHEECTLCVRTQNKEHLRKHCPENPTPGVDPKFQAERNRRDKERKERDAKKKKRQGGARVAGVGQNTDTDTESDDESDNDSDCSDQSVYDDEQATSVQSADVMLSSTFFTPGVSSSFDVSATGAARVAVGEERPAVSALAQMREREHAAQLARSEHTLLLAQREAAAAELARHAAAAAAQAPAAPSTPVAFPSTATIDVSGNFTLQSILALSDADRAAISPLRRDDARRLVASLDPVSSPLRSMQLLARAADLSEVRLGCGPPSDGSTVNRTKAHVLADMRVAVGLSPAAVPMGLPIETGGGNAASSPKLPPIQTFLSSPTVLSGGQQPPAPPHIAQSLCPAGTCWLSMCTCDINWNSSPLPLQPPVPLTDSVPTPMPAPPAVNGASPPMLGGTPSAPTPNGTDFGLTGFDARGGADITGKQIVADLCGDPATRYTMVLSDGTTLRALCPLDGPAITTVPPPGSIYLGIDASHTRVWATTDGHIIRTAAKQIAAASAAANAPPLPLPPPPNGWFNRRTVCCAVMAFLTHILVLGVAVGWAAGRPSTGVGFIVGLPDSAHDAGTFARRVFDLFSLSSVTYTVIRLLFDTMSRFGYICITLLRCGYLPATLLHKVITSLPAQRWASCQGCLLMLAAATLRSIMAPIIHVAWTLLAVPGHLLCVTLGAATYITIPCAIAFTICLMLAAIPDITRTLIDRLRRAWGRVSRLIPPGSPPPWDTSTIHTRRQDYIHRSNWEGRFAGARRTCRAHLVSAIGDWHLPWWLFMLALQWMVVVILDIGARMLNYRVATSSYRETMPLLGGETPITASTLAMGRWMARWLRHSYAGARHHLSRSRRKLASALLIFTTYLLHNLSARGISGITRGALGWLQAWLVIKLQLFSHSGRAFLRLAVATPPAIHSLLWLLHANVAHRCSIVRPWLQGIIGWLLFVSRLSLILVSLAWQHWTGPRAMAVARLPRAARTHPKANATAVAAATAAATAPPVALPPDESATGSTPATPAALPSLPRGRVGYALMGARHGKTRAKVKSSRALPARSDPSPSLPGFWPTRHHVTRWLRVVIDSGCTWHVHNCLEDLINSVPCADVIVDANGHKVTCAFKGDLPLLAQDSDGKEFRMVLRGVRYSPSFEDTLISVDQLWYASSIDTRFRDMRHLRCTKSQVNGKPLTLPFGRHRGLYMWNVAVAPPKAPSPPAVQAPRECFGRTCSLGRALKSGIHAASSHSHVRTLPADDVAAVLHRRLHVGLNLLKRLGGRSSDAPSHVASATEVTCPHCVAANGHRLAHSSSQYQSSHAGRLVHADIAGPFKRSWLGGFQYALILTDDHTRFKFIYFLKNKSDAPDRVRRFIASFNALANLRSDSVVRVVSTIHTDNAGEFLSHQFQELLDESLVSLTTCPPHVHQLNGVAERAILAVCSLARSYFAASAVPVTFWPFAFQMAVDVLNRTTGPTAGGLEGPSSYELLTGEKPRVMNILPFGCRAYAVKPRSQYSKTTIDPRAWIGYNLGRSARSPGAYEIHVPGTGRIVTTSDVYFQESLFPCRPRGQQTDESAPGPPTHAPPDTSQPPGIPPVTAAPVPGPAPDAADSDALSDADTIEDEGEARRASRRIGSTGWARRAAAYSAALGRALDDAARDIRGHTTPLPRRVLVLFSGPYERPDGITAFLRAKGLEVDQYDCDAKNGGGESADILNDAFFTSLFNLVRNGHYAAIFTAPPCSTYSVARHFTADRPGQDRGPPVVRTRKQILGISNVPVKHQRELRRANEVTRRTALLLTAAYRAGTEFVLENPADRGDEKQTLLYQVAEHGPIWLDPHVEALRRSCSAESVTFAQCMFGADVQKYTTLLFTAGLAPMLRPLHQMVCSHSPGTHAMAGGAQRADGTWNSAPAAAYPADFNLFVSDAFVTYILGREGNDATRPIVTASADPGDTSPPPQSGFGAVTDQPVQPPVQPPPPPSPPSPPPVASPVHEPPPTYPSPPSDAAPHSPHSPPSPPKVRRGHIPASERWHRTLGPYPTRDRRPAAAKLASSDSPSNRREAIAADEKGWTTAEGGEIDNHESKGSWSYHPRASLPHGRRLVKLTWAYKVKRDLTKKARLCVQGCTQIAGVDYHQTFCAAMRVASLRVLCAISARLGLKMRRWDFVAAYLQGELEPGEVVFCTPPPGYSTALIDGKVHLVLASQGDGVDRICRVEKPVYGMAQAGRRWQRTIFPWILAWRGVAADGSSIRLEQSKLDTCVFTCRSRVSTPSGPRDEILMLGIYVDDLFANSSHDDEHSIYSQFFGALSDEWDVEDEGEVSDLLSIEIHTEGKCVILRQRAYIEKLLATFAPDGVPISTFSGGRTLASQPPGQVPADVSLNKLVDEAMLQDVNSIDQKLLKDYQSLIGSLLYCAVNTRPDVAFAVGYLCRAMGRPTPELYAAALRVLFYLHHHRHVGLRYEADSRELSGQSDSDWAVKHSTTGYVFNYSVAAISWASKKQATVALSSCEAEVVALSEGAKEGVYLRRFLEDLGFPSPSPTPVATDNTGAKALAYNPEHHERVKHVERRHFYVRELVEDGLLTVPYVSTTSNMADFFTKPLAAAHFFALRNLIMNFERPVPSESVRAHARVSRRDQRHQRAGGCRDTVPTARDPVDGIRTGIGIRVDLAASAVGSRAAAMPEGVLDMSYVCSDYSGVAPGSGSVAATVQRTDVRPAPERFESGLKTGCFP